MANKIEYLAYTVNLTDAAQVAALQATQFAFPNGNEIGHPLFAPDDAATFYEAPKLAHDAPFVAPSTTSEWFGSEDHFPTNVAFFERCSGGWFGVCFLFGKKITYVWRATFALAPGAVDDSGAIPKTVSPLPQRRWIDGMELPFLGEGAAAGSVGSHARKASRHVDGYGLALDISSGTRTHNVNENAAGLTPTQSWERFYLRPRVAPLVATGVWQGKGSVEAATGIQLDVSPTLQLALSTLSNVGVASLLGSTVPLTLHEWVKVDVVFEFGAASKAKLFLNGVESLSVSSLGGTGVGTAGRTHTLSRLLNGSTAVDIDDWMCADWPQHLISPLTHTAGLDWINGSKMQLVRATGFAATHNALWLGDWRIAMQNPVDGAGGAFTSSTSGVKCCLTTDAEDAVDALPNALGIAAFCVAAHTTRAGAANGTLGATMGTGGLSGVPATTIVQTVGANWNTLLYRPAALPTPEKMLATEIFHVKGADATAATIKALAIVAEVIGTFGPEDAPVTVPPTDPPLPSLGIHNAPYPRSPWATPGTPPQSPVVIVGGTYTGTGTFIDLPFRCPVHWFWVRPLTGDTGGVKWWSSLDGAHFKDWESTRANLMVQVCIDPLGSAFAPSAGTYTDLVSTVKADVIERAIIPVPQTTNEHAAAITWRVAWRLRAAGAKLIKKTPVQNGADATGAHAGERYSHDAIAFAAGGFADVLISAGPPNNFNTPTYAFTPGAPPVAGTVADPWDLDDGAGAPDGEDSQQQQTVIRMVGNDTQNNAVGVVYQYCAFCDPGMRFLLNAALAHSTGAADVTTPLVSDDFLPVAAFAWQEVLGAATTARIHYKGPGHAAASISPLGAAEVANALAFGTGFLTSKSAFHGSWSQVGVSLWRKDDGSGDVGIPRVVQIQSYIGDGAASRTIALAPASGRRPLFALVQPHNGTAFYRDPSHTGANSTGGSGAVGTTGITAGGIDSISLGTSLNTNGVVYDVFVLPGCETAGNAGWSVNCETMPVDPIPPIGGPWDPEPFGDPTVPGESTEPPPPVVPTPDFSTACVDATTRLVNIALSRVGSSIQIANVATDISLEASTARLHYADEVEATLRAFPWPFATRYAALTIVGGTEATPVNGDWQYSYRVPADLLFARRIVPPGGQRRAFDPSPITFRVGSDATGGVIYTSALAPVLEYTVRLSCPASQGDVLFRTALTWRLAHAFAPALARDDKKTGFCLAMFERTIATAEAAGANEAQPDKNDGDASWIRERN